MKRLKINILGSIIGFLALMMTSCEFGDTNVDPSQPQDVQMAALLPAAQAGIAWSIGGEQLRFSGLFMQYFNGINAQQLDNGKYLIRESDTDGMWGDMMTDVLNNVQIVIEKAEAAGAPHYEGLAQVMMVAGIANLTDCFGDIPFTEAFQGDEAIGGDAGATLSPVYDGQQALYTSLQTMLDAAITNLEETVSAESPGADDLIFGGNLSNWIKAAYGLKARLYLHTSKINGAAAYDNVLTATANAMSSNAEDFEMTFGTAPNEASPQYQFVQDRGGNIEFGAFFMNLLTSRNDPRAVHYLSDVADPKFDIGTYYTLIGSPVPLLSYAEVKFMEAEAHLLGSTQDLAASEAALQEAVAASLTKIAGANDATFVTTYASFTGLTTDDERLEKIIEQKYLALYSHGIESWTDFRRTGYPALTPNADGSNAFNANGEIPRRLPYPQNERLLNPNIPITTPNLQTRFWWDTM